jgi:hypothetical protein
MNRKERPPTSKVYTTGGNESHAGEGNGDMAVSALPDFALLTNVEILASLAWRKGLG